MSKTPSKRQTASVNLPAEHAFIVAAHAVENGALEGEVVGANRPEEGGVSTNSPANYPEGTGRKPSCEIDGGDGQVDKGGRPPAMDETTKTLACTLFSVGLSRRQAAAYVGVSHTTIGYAIEHDEAFAARVEKAEHLAVVKPLLTIANLSHNNWKAAVWLLERNERRRKPSRDEIREAEEERLRREKESQEASLRMMRDFREMSEELNRPKVEEAPEAPINYALAQRGLKSANPTAAEQAEIDKVTAMVKRLAKELPEDDDSLDENENWE